MEKHVQPLPARLVYDYHPDYRGYVVFWQLWQEVESEPPKRRWYEWKAKKPETKYEWLTEAVYDDLYAAKQALFDYVNGVRQ